MANKCNAKQIRLATESDEDPELKLTTDKNRAAWVLGLKEVQKWCDAGGSDEETLMEQMKEHVAAVAGRMGLDLTEQPSLPIGSVSDLETLMCDALAIAVRVLREAFWVCVETHEHEKSIDYVDWTEKRLATLEWRAWRAGAITKIDNGVVVVPLTLELDTVRRRVRTLCGDWIDGAALLKNVLTEPDQNVGYADLGPSIYRLYPHENA